MMQWIHDEDHGEFEMGNCRDGITASLHVSIQCGSRDKEGETFRINGRDGVAVIRDGGICIQDCYKLDKTPMPKALELLCKPVKYKTV